MFYENRDVSIDTSPDFRRGANKICISGIKRNNIYENTICA